MTKALLSFIDTGVHNAFKSIHRHISSAKLYIFLKRSSQLCIFNEPFLGCNGVYGNVESCEDLVQEFEGNGMFSQLSLEVSRVKLANIQVVDKLA